MMKRVEDFLRGVKFTFKYWHVVIKSPVKSYQYMDYLKNFSDNCNSDEYAGYITAFIFELWVIPFLILNFIKKRLHFKK